MPRNLSLEKPPGEADKTGDKQQDTVNRNQTEKAFTPTKGASYTKRNDARTQAVATADV